jgi:outer membrane scaffolding protein for murein synthesis (MipA/OmpV family)
VISDEFPLVVRSDLRYLLRAGGGLIGDLGLYMPIPGSSERFATFAGPAVTVASRHYLNDLFGVTGPQSVASGHPVYGIRNVGIEAAGLGLSAAWRITPHYILNVDGAINRLGHEAAMSPLTERPSAHVLTVSLDYHW